MEILFLIIRIVLILCCVGVAIRSIKSFIEAREAGDDSHSGLWSLILSLVFAIYLIVRIIASSYN